MAGTSKAKTWRKIAKQYELEYDKTDGILSGKLNGFDGIIGPHPSGELVGMVAFIRRSICSGTRTTCKSWNTKRGAGRQLTRAPPPCSTTG